MSNEDYTKHSVTTDALSTLGSIITPNEKRDAIHLAVEPVEAAHKLYAGMDVKLVDGRAERAYDESEGVGIVDPFLKSPVHVGEMFWLVVYPRQISSLRHVWEHPSFPSSGETDHIPTKGKKIPKVVSLPDPSIEENRIKAEKLDRMKVNAEDWLRGYADRIGLGFDTLMDLVSEQYGQGYLVSYGSDMSEEIPDEFWTQMSLYKGETYTSKEGGSYFSCSC